MRSSYQGVPAGGGSATGDVVGPATSTDNAIARFDGGTGKLLQSSPVRISDAGALTGTRRSIVDYTSDDDLTTSVSGVELTNDGAPGVVVLNLPPSSEGIEFVATIQSAQILRFQADGTDVIYAGSTASTAGGTMESNVVGSKALISCSKTGRWNSLTSGTWTVA